jgi:hypothetical protein
LQKTAAPLHFSKEIDMDKRIALTAILNVGGAAFAMLSPSDFAGTCLVAGA